MLHNTIIAEGLWRLTNWFSCSGIWDCGMAFTIGPVFEEAYAVRAAIIASQSLQLPKVRDIAHAFCDRAVSTQGMVETDMYYMGYAGQRNDKGIPNCSCVADASSSATTILASVRAYPDSPNTSMYIDSVRRFVDYVLSTYRTDNGVIGVGIVGHDVNPLPEYWCANALFTPTLLGLAELTGDDAYFDAAVAPLEYLATFDYRNTDDRQWSRSATELIFYTSEGIWAGLRNECLGSRLERPIRDSQRSATISNAPDTTGQALNRIKANDNRQSTAACNQMQSVRVALLHRWNEFADWLARNQDVDGTWEDTKEYRCYQMGLTWSILQHVRADLQQQPLLTCAARQLHYLNRPESRIYMRLFSEPFGTALAYLSFAEAADYSMQMDSEAFNSAGQDVYRSLAGRWW